jgi:L-alanine-DL-glutamate epimerase-like enolase superfamily enzyme
VTAAASTSAASVRLEVSGYTVPTDAPEGDGTFAWDATSVVVVQARRGEHVGLGWTYGPVAAGAVIRELLVPALAGRDVDDVPAAWEAMRSARRNAGRVGIGSLALSAVDCALWDLAARRRGLPLAVMLGAARDTVPVYGSGGFTTYDAHQQQAQLAGWAREQGIPRVKIKIGESRGTCEGRDLERIAAARRTIGDDVELYVDANGGYTVKQAIRVGRAAEAADVRWFEEPVSSDDLAGLVRVRDAVVADVAAGEYGFDLPYFARLLPSVDCLQIDVTRCGGISEFRRAAAIGDAVGVQVSGHCAPHQHLAVAAATPNLRHLEWFHDHVRIEDLFFDGSADPAGGTITVDRTAPGNGLVLRASDAAPYQVAGPST